MSLLRSVASVIVGVVLTSLIVEPLEFGLVALLNGAPVTDPDTYLAIRNQPAFLAAKLVYNGLGGIAGGYAAALVAGRRPVLHAGVAAALQGALLLFAASDPMMRLSTPLWAWIGIGVTTPAGLLLGGWLRARRAVKVSASQP